MWACEAAERMILAVLHMMPDAAPWTDPVWGFKRVFRGGWPFPAAAQPLMENQ